MTYIHIFTEESSIKEVLDVILPKILPENVEFRIYPHQGKDDLEIALARMVPSLSQIPGSKIIVTRDQDALDCKIVKKNLLQIIEGKCNCPYKICIVCRELESWFLGDLPAIESAYNRFKSNQYANKAQFRNIDGISKPSQLLKKIIPDYTHHKSLFKIGTAQRIAPHMNLETNKSASFQHFIKTIKTLLEE